MRVVATYSIKGGVGKTSAAINLAALAALEGRRTLLWDLDPQGAATYLLRVQPKVKGGARKLIDGRRNAAGALKGSDVEGLDLLPADFSYRNLDLVLDREDDPRDGLARVLRPLADEYDLVVLDCAPSISLVTEGVFAASDLLLVPLIPSTLSVRTLEQLEAFLADTPGRPPDVLAFLSMVDRRRRLHRELAASLPEELGVLAGPGIPAASAVELMGVHREPLVVRRPSDPAARAYVELWRAVAARLDEQG